MKFKILCVIALIASNNCYASKNFKCVVKHSVTLENDGKLSTESDTARNNFGKEFIVNRSNGQITGGGFTNTMSGQMPVVYDYQPNENGYKAITIYKPNSTVDYLQINEYIEGDKKPFFFKSAWGSLVSGLCMYY